jgi:hypothetical protein
MTKPTIITPGMGLQRRAIWEAVRKEVESILLPLPRKRTLANSEMQSFIR